MNFSFPRLLFAGILHVIVANLPLEQLQSQVGEQSIANSLRLEPDAHWPTVDQPIAVAVSSAPRLSSGEFSLAAWIRDDDQSGNFEGDIISQYDPRLRRGFHLTLKSNTGVTSNQAGWRHLQFGIDDDRASTWQDCGRPGNALFAFAMAAHTGQLFVGTCEPGGKETGRVYKYSAPSTWQDCGSLDGSNSVTAMAVFENSLYAGTGKYRVAGSSLPESENNTLGGRVFRYDGDNRWIDCGQLPGVEAVGGLVQFRKRLYATSLYKPAGFFRYEGQRTWTSLPVPAAPVPLASNGDDRSSGQSPAEKVESRRVVSMCVYQNNLYATSYDCGHIYRFDGDTWSDCGLVGENTQCYAFANYDGNLHVATWPSGRVYRFVDIGNWIDIGRLGEELEVMGMAVHNGRLIAGTLPNAHVYAYAGERQWTLLEQLDRTPDVRYRRAWTMSEFSGKLFCSTLPSGKIFAFEQGSQVSWEHSLNSGWHHVVAAKSNNQLSLWIDGQKVSERQFNELATYNLTSEAPWRIGNGMNGTFQGKIQDLRFYQRVLTGAEIDKLVNLSAPSN